MLLLLLFLHAASSFLDTHCLLLLITSRRYGALSALGENTVRNFEFSTFRVVEDPLFGCCFLQGKPGMIVGQATAPFATLLLWSFAWLSAQLMPSLHPVLQQHYSSLLRSVNLPLLLMRPFLSCAILARKCCRSM